MRCKCKNLISFYKISDSSILPRDIRPSKKWQWHYVFNIFLISYEGWRESFEYYKILCCFRAKNNTIFKVMILRYCNDVNKINLTILNGALAHLIMRFTYIIHVLWKYYVRILLSFNYIHCFVIYHLLKLLLFYSTNKSHSINYCLNLGCTAKKEKKKYIAL